MTDQERKLATYLYDIDSEMILSVPQVLKIVKQISANIKPLKQIINED